MQINNQMSRLREVANPHRRLHDRGQYTKAMQLLPQAANKATAIENKIFRFLVMSNYYQKNRED